MQRTQIYFPKSLHEDLKIAAAAANVSLSEYIRMSLKEDLYTKKVDLTLLAKKAIDLGPPDLAKNFSKYFEASFK